MSTYNSNRLYHSDIYLGQDFSDGIKHYKYLKKVKSSSGKWRYIYDESEMRNEEKKIELLKKTVSDENGNIRYINSQGDHVTRFKDGATGTVYGSSKQSNKDKLTEKAVTEIDKMTKKHNTQKLKDIPKRIISRGIGFINKLIMDLEKKWVK